MSKSEFQKKIFGPLDGDECTKYFPVIMHCISFNYDGGYKWIFLGSEGSVVIAALTASDFYDEVVIADLEDYNNPLSQDIEWSVVDVRRLDHASICEVFTEP